MDKKSRVVTIVMVGIMCLLAFEIYFWPFIATFFLSINSNIALILVLVSLVFKRYQIKRAQYVIFIILLLQAFNVFKFTLDIIGSYYSEKSVLMNIGSLSISPIPFVLLLAYGVINRKTLQELILNMLHGSDEERKDKRDKLERFYYDNFKMLTPKEFNDALLMFNDYPDEAKVALNKLKDEIRSGEFIRD
jgi:hypothetical protein